MSLLRKCPFCGGEAVTLDMRYQHWVYCTKCDAKTSIFETKGEAIEAWNKRYEPSEQERWLNGE